MGGRGKGEDKLTPETMQRVRGRKSGNRSKGKDVDFFKASRDHIMDWIKRKVITSMGVYFKDIDE